MEKIWRGRNTNENVLHQNGKGTMLLKVLWVAEFRMVKEVTLTGADTHFIILLNPCLMCE